LIKIIKKYKKYLKKYLEYITYDPKVFWDDWGGEKYFNQFNSAEGLRYENIFLEQIERLKPNSIIDIGCGYGRYLKVISKNFPNIKLVGIDISSSQIEYAKEYCKNFPNIELFEIDGKNIPFEKNTFDMSITYGCLTYVKPIDINSFFKQIKNITKQYSILIEHNNESKYNPMEDKFWSYKHNYNRLFCNESITRTILSSNGDTMFILKYKA